MKPLHKPLSLISSVFGGVVAGAAFERLWKRVSSGSTIPTATSTRHSTGEVLAAAALRGLIFGVVTAAIERAGARSVERLTDTDAGDTV